MDVGPGAGAHLNTPTDANPEPAVAAVAKPLVDAAANTIEVVAMAPSAAANPASASAGVTPTATAPSINHPMEAAASGVEDASHQPGSAGTGPPIVGSTAPVVNAAAEATDSLVAIAKPMASNFGTGLSPIDTPASAKDSSQPFSADSSHAQ